MVQLIVLLLFLFLCSFYYDCTCLHTTNDNKYDISCRPTNTNVVCILNVKLISNILMNDKDVPVLYVVSCFISIILFHNIISVSSARHC